ncbi:MAG: hypothetical protein IKS76_01595 [Paludibacteraceae bacterium]|nr:hypothetical protein [Paludibacteraceae bacterium]
MRSVPTVEMVDFLIDVYDALEKAYWADIESDAQHSRVPYEGKFCRGWLVDAERMVKDKLEELTTSTKEA